MSLSRALTQRSVTLLMSGIGIEDEFVSVRQFMNYLCVTVSAGLLPVFSKGGSSAEGQRR